MNIETPVALPPVILGQTDGSALFSLAVFHMLSDPRSAGALLEELGRAIIVPDESLPDDVVGLESSVSFLQDGEPGEAVVVLPEAVGDDKQHVSALTNLGIGLLGLSPGQAMLWPDRRGGSHLLEILAVKGRSSHAWRGVPEAKIQA